MDAFDEIVLEHYTANGSTQIAMIPQYAVPPGENWSIDLVGIDLRYKCLLFIEVSTNQTPNTKLIDKINRRSEWIPNVRASLSSESSVIDHTWNHLTVVYIIDSRVEWLRKRLGDPSDVVVASLKDCLPYWITSKEPQRGMPRVVSDAAQPGAPADDSASGALPLRQNRG